MLNSTKLNLLAKQRFGLKIWTRMWNKLIFDYFFEFYDFFISASLVWKKSFYFLSLVLHQIAFLAKIQNRSNKKSWMEILLLSKFLVIWSKTWMVVVFPIQIFWTVVIFTIQLFWLLCFDKFFAWKE